MRTHSSGSHHGRRLLLLASLSALVAPSYAWGTNCYYDVYGYQQCDGLNYGARVGIAIAILALLVILIGLFYARRRRMARFQQAALANGRVGANNTGANSQNQNYYGGSNSYGPPQSGNTAYGYAPQQPYGAPPASAGQQYYEQQSQTYNYGPSAEAWQPPPPKYEPPPPESQNVTKGTENGNANNNMTSPPAPAPYSPPAGAPPNPSNPWQSGNDNRV